MQMRDRERVEGLLREAKKAVQAKALDQAAEHLKEALAIDPEDIPCLDLMGFVLFFQKRYKESETCCIKTLAIKPNHAYALAGLGMNQARQGRLAEGLKSLRRAIEIQPRWPDAYWDLAIVLKEAGHYDEALDVLKDGLVHCPGSRVRFEGLIAHVEALREKG